MTASIRPSDGAVVLNGQPFFPVGLYHVSHYDMQDARRLTDLGLMASAGFNTVATPLKLANAGPFLARCADLGVWALVENNDPQGILAMVQALKGQTGLLGWQIYDDLGRPGSKTPAEVKALHDQVKAIDPGALTYSSYGGNPREFYKYVGTVDILGCQTYPIPGEQLSSTTNYIDICARAASASQRSVIANCQMFGWAGKVPPTPAQARMMCYRSLIVNARGVIFYTMFDPTWELRTSALWPTAAALAKELVALGPEVLSGALR